LRGQQLNIVFRARDSPSLRAIMNSYLRMLKATTTVCVSIFDIERGRGKREVK
jgi:tRNA threonylcarbamoyladenosine modification (KEOPS) complex  Pcc1 subunit